jgi:hypothetical protein
LVVRLSNDPDRFGKRSDGARVEIVTACAWVGGLAHASDCAFWWYEGSFGAERCGHAYYADDPSTPLELKLSRRLKPGTGLVAVIHYQMGQIEVT